MSLLIDFAFCIDRLCWNIAREIESGQTCVGVRADTNGKSPLEAPSLCSPSLRCFFSSVRSLLRSLDTPHFRNPTPFILQFPYFVGWVGAWYAFTTTMRRSWARGASLLLCRSLRNWLCSCYHLHVRLVDPETSSNSHRIVELNFCVSIRYPNCAIKTWKQCCSIALFSSFSSSICLFPLVFRLHRREQLWMSFPLCLISRLLFIRDERMHPLVCSPFFVDSILVPYL